MDCLRETPLHGQIVPVSMSLLANHARRVGPEYLTSAIEWPENRGADGKYPKGYKLNNGSHIKAVNGTFITASGCGSPAAL
uniref:Uncharacterized protein n=1 Tax=Physcomitrium patens TaxID=3218 RepID=A0A2K1J7V4_PHYPA|nr:hypothetical protein PHYPA_020721 [Physcomitrium patens]